MTVLASTMPAICQNIGKGRENGRSATSFTSGASPTCQTNGSTSSHRCAVRCADTACGPPSREVIEVATRVPRASKLLRCDEVATPMRVTVTQMHDAPADFARDWVRLAEHVRLERSEVVLLPEMPFHPCFATPRTYDPTRWQAAVADHDGWEKRHGELGARHVLGTRPVDFGNERYNSAFIWDAASGVRM